MLITLAAAATFIGAPLGAWAHHAFSSEFDADKPFTVTGTVVKVEWVNPHSWIHIDVTEEELDGYLTGNLKGTYLTTQAVVRQMKQQQSGNCRTKNCHDRLSLAPPPGPSNFGDVACLNRFAMQKSLQILLQIGGRLIPTIRCLFQTLQADRLQILGNLAIQLARAGSVFNQDLMQQHARAAAKRTLAGE